MPDANLLNQFGKSLALRSFLEIIASWGQNILERIPALFKGHRTLHKIHAVILLVLVILLLELSSSSRFGVTNDMPILQLIIIYSAITGGLVIGLTSAAITMLYSLYYLSYPGSLLVYSPEDMYRLLVVSLTAPLTAVLAGILHNYSKKLIEERVVRVRSELEQEKIKNILESITDAFIALDKEWRFTYVNNRAAQFMRKTTGVLMGRNIWKLFPGAADLIFYKKAHEVAKSGKSEHFAEYIKNRDMWIDFNIYPAKEGLSVYFSDITAKKNTEDKLKESEERFHTMANTAPVMIWMAGPDKKFNYYNKGWLDFVGRTIKQERGGGWVEGVYPEDRACFIDTFNVSFEAQIEFQMEFRLKRHDGEYRWILNNGIPRFTQKGEFLGYIGSCIDITERKEVEKRKDDFLSIASHELKTPITSIKAFTQLLIKEHEGANLGKEAKHHQYLSRMAVHIDNLMGLITDLLDVSRIEQGRLKFNKTSFKLDGLVREIIEDFETTNEKFKVTLNGNSSLLVFGDKERIGQVLVNFLNNAAKYSPDADKIIVEIEDNNHSTKVKVKDYGIGISKEDQDKVFGRFFRVESSNNNTFPGLGLGLYISSEIIKRHGGSIGLKSVKGKGSVFYFTLPKVLPRRGKNQFLDKYNYDAKTKQGVPV